MIEFNIYFRDLNTNTQKNLLEAFGLSGPEDINWDVCPICTLEIYDKEESDKD